MRPHDTRFLEAVRLELRDELDRAEALYRNILLEDDPDPRAAVNLGTIYYNQGDYTRAVRCYRQAEKGMSKTAICRYSTQDAHALWSVLWPFSYASWEYSQESCGHPAFSFPVQLMLCPSIGHTMCCLRCWA